MDFRRIETLLAQTGPENIVILCHQNADPDAIGSAVALAQLLKKIQPNTKVEIAAPNLNQISKTILTTFQLPTKITRTPKIPQADIIFVVDTNNIQQLRPWHKLLEITKTPIVIIDHHTVHPETKKIADLAIIKEKATSTCEIIYQLYNQGQIPLTTIVAQTLFLGIAFDTRHFTIANATTFHVVADLTSYGIKVKDALTLLHTPMNISERISRLKAAKRLKMVKIDGWTIAFSRVSSYQSSAARALIGLGAHVAIVYGQKKNEFRISMRSTDDFFEKTQIHLGRDVAQQLEKHINGLGGGHSTAAGVNGEGEFKDVFKKCYTIIQEKISHITNQR